MPTGRKPRKLSTTSTSISASAPSDDPFSNLSNQLSDHLINVCIDRVHRFVADFNNPFDPIIRLASTRFSELVAILYFIYKSINLLLAYQQEENQQMAMAEAIVSMPSVPTDTPTEMTSSAIPPPPAIPLPAVPINATPPVVKNVSIFQSYASNPMI